MGIRLSLKDALQRMPSRVLLALLATSAFASVWIASSGAVSAREAKAGAVAKAGPIGVLARAMALNLTVHMHLVGRPGHLLVEQGRVSGTFSGSAFSRNTALGSNQGVSTFTISSKAGSLSGRASSRGHVVGPTAYFVGSGTITGGTGTWAHAAGSHLQFSGTMDRQNYNVTDRVTGTVRY